NASVDVIALIVQAEDVSTAAALVEDYGGQVNEQFTIIDAVSANVPVTAVEALSADSRVVSVFEDYTAEIAGSRSRNPVVNFPQVMGVDQAWEEHVNGKKITVAVVDTGIAPMSWNSGRIIARYDALDDGPRIKDPNGHGTMMASLIGNSQKDENGFMGIAPKVKFVDVRVLNSDGSGNYADILEGLNWVLENQDEYNIRVVNLSLLAAVNSPYWADPINQAVEALWDAGIVVVVASGNGGSAPMTVAVPGNDPFVITVGAFTDNFTPEDESDDYLAPFSGAGPTETGFVKPDVIAPGAHMIASVKRNAVWPQEHPDNKVKKEFYETAGTSSAAAVTSGVIALMLQENPDMTPGEVKYALMASARPAAYDEQSLTWSIFQQGAGRVWAPDAVFNPAEGNADGNMVPGEKYVGPAVYRDGEFVLVDENG
ncbi:MAG: S8 family peptidase, partial [Anaerolineales bacterium]|nr:S8 family peptidase [Anaerolineales bacterium]